MRVRPDLRGGVTFAFAQFSAPPILLWPFEVVERSTQERSCSPFKRRADFFVVTIDADCVIVGAASALTHGPRLVVARYGLSGRAIVS
jgi:hypothetical protein